MNTTPSPHMTDEEFAAMEAYAAEHGRGWKDRLMQAWMCDWREQWGVLRCVRNDPHYHQGKGMPGIFKTFEAERARRNKE